MRDEDVRAAEDGLMLDLLEGFRDQPLSLPTRRRGQPDRARIDARFTEFRRLTA